MLFSAQIFFILLRETLELVLIILVLLAFVRQSFDGSPLRRQLQVQVLAGAACGLGGCLLVGAAIIALFYRLEVDYWLLAEHYWEGIFLILLLVIISVLGFGMLRFEQWQLKWEHKLRRKVDSEGVGRRLSDRYAMFVLPFVTTLREGLEAVVFVGGVGLLDPVETIPLSAVLALAIGSAVGIVVYRTGVTLRLRYFMVASTCLLYLVAAGLFSKGLWQLELQHYINLCGGQDMLEVGSGPGLYDILRSVWHVNCCNGEIDGGWMLFLAVLGWTNSATYWSVGGYIGYWVVIVAVVYRKWRADQKLVYESVRTSIDSTAPLLEGLQHPAGNTAA